jgi:hypothetical protein
MSPPVSRAANTPQPFLVALAAWALPGLGYTLIGQRARGITVGVAIVILFVFGLLIGGARALEVPMVEREEVQRRRLVNPSEPAERLRFIDEVRAKPWSIAQVFAGPVALAGGYVSAWAGTLREDPTTHEWAAPGVESHARVNEIAVLYTAVAGMLNLLAIIDSAHRAGRLLEQK